MPRLKEVKIKKIFYNYKNKRLEELSRHLDIIELVRGGHQWIVKKNFHLAL